MFLIALVLMAALLCAKGFHVKYNIICGKEIIISPEMDAKIIVKCKNGYKKYESSGCMKIRIPIYDRVPKRDVCQMNKFDNQQLYGLTVVCCEKVSSYCLNYRKKVLTCSYEPHENVKTSEIALMENYLNFEEISVENGRRSNLKMILHLENILGERIHERFYVGRKVRLVGKVAQTSHVAGILVRNCYATNGYKRIPILVAGCGTGTVFSPYANFFTYNTQVFSPYFTLFQLTPQDKTLMFVCTFIVCSKNCNGGSCLNNSWGDQIQLLYNHQRNYRNA